MIALWRRLHRASVWHPGAISSGEGAASLELKRYVLPAFDALIVVMGLCGVILGMPSFRVLYDESVAGVSGWLLLTGGVLAFWGVGWPAWWPFEALGKLLMLPVIGGYAAALWWLTFTGEGERWIVACAVTSMLVLPVWTLARLGREHPDLFVRVTRRRGGA